MQVMRAKINKASFIKKMQVPSAGTEENIHRNPQTSEKCSNGNSREIIIVPPILSV